MNISPRRRWLILAICCMSLLIVGTDATIVNVALPAIRRDLGASVSGLQWAVDAYTLVLGSLLMASGSMADRFGRRRVFQIGLVLFTLGSLLCSLAPNIGLLVAFRCLQAVGGAMLNPVALSIVSNTFTERRGGGRGGGGGGGGFARQPGARPGCRRGARHGRELAGDLLDQRADRDRRDRLDPAVRARVEGGHRAPLRPVGPAAGHRHAGHAHLRGDRGALARL